MPRSSGKTQDLHGNAPDECRVALLIIDMINAFEFDGAQGMLPRALAAARATATLKRRARRAGVPVIYVNDNFLEHMASVTKADIRPSADIDLSCVTD